jgi:hypothetical protein
MPYKYNNDLTLEKNIEKSQMYKFKVKKSQAKSLGIEWNIRFQEVEWNDYCPVYDIRLDWFNEGKAKDNTPSFDRTDSDKGYVAGNVVVMSWRANRLKNNARKEDIIALADYMENID